MRWVLTSDGVTSAGAAAAAAAAADVVPKAVAGIYSRCSRHHTVGPSVTPVTIPVVASRPQRELLVVPPCVCWHVLCVTGGVGGLSPIPDQR